ncbi:TetR family transcriptional regulator [Bacillus sp. SA1-12]|uniref:TetR/AcrR family transcriptional regulator n=1 Tax=Bacillus sp. SA1-12 TaxID=1455638 RepID=UPI0006271A1D|nr:TetR/AcrR family transcriptional regulator [Bacillus sp. SA1-12]KKI90033.1 TetR family transcriptional regulator [Bacillus sp. SA1-12]
MARKKEFDEDAALLKAMRLFWEQGYEKTSMQELVSHMGVHKGSIYDTFGDKQSLYIKTLKRYSEMLEQAYKRRMADTRSAKEAIRVLLEMAIQRNSLYEQQEEFPVGCFLVNTAVELAKHDSEAIDLVHLRWTYTQQIIYDLIVEGQQSGELSKALNAEALSYYFINALIGLRVMVKTISDRKKLQEIIEMNLSVLDC